MDCQSPEIFLKNAIQYKYALNGSTTLTGASKPRTHGELSFKVIIRSDVKAYQIAYVSGSRQYPEVDAITKPIVVPDKYRFIPKNLRLSIVPEEQNTMRLMWTSSTNDPNLKASYVKFGKSSTSLNRISRPVVLYSFGKENLCEPSLYPAGSVGYSSLGVQVEVLMRHLEPNETYYYTVVYKLDYVWKKLPVKQFVNVNYVNGAKYSGAKLVAFGDMGQSMFHLDGSYQHSFDNENKGEVAAQNTAYFLKNLTSTHDFDLIAHFGDISYSTGQLGLWDTFMFQIEPISATLPWMPGIGNHEIGSEHSFVVGSDSQGECGVPYMSLFPFAQRFPILNTDSNKVRKQSRFVTNEYLAKQYGENKVIEPYYSFIIKNVYCIMMSTEHDFGTGSKQFHWLQSELLVAHSMVSNTTSNVDWILFLGHRPMYISDKYPETTSRRLVKYIEPLLFKYNVNIAMWGHHHSYQRFKCKIYKGKCSKQGIVQIVSGHAGFAHSPISHSSKFEELYEVKDNKHWGISTLNFVNKTHCKIEYLENTDGKLIDSFWVSKASTTLL